MGATDACAGPETAPDRAYQCPLGKSRKYSPDNYVVLVHADGSYVVSNWPGRRLTGNLPKSTDRPVSQTRWGGIVVG